jgi:predicted AAA+ superfamily ATPase
MVFQRALLPNILRLLQQFSCVGLVGPRQVGKTTLVKSLSSMLSKPVVYFDLENLNDYQKFEQDPIFLLSQYENYTVIIDEVQRMLPLFPLLRSLIDQKREAGRFILLGAASPEFLAKSTESLAGRIAYLELTPIRLDECSAQISMSQHWFRGGFPEALLMPDDTIWFDWQENFVRTYMDSDLRILGLNIQPMTLARLLRIIGSMQGSMVNYSDIANSMGVSMPTIKNYIDYLEHAFIIRRLSPFHVNINKRLVKTPKIYFRDSGNLHYLLNLTSYDSLVNHIMVGHSWEGYVIEQIINRLKRSVLPYFYRTQHGAEMDLVLVSPDKPVVCIEIKLSNSPKLSKGAIQSVEDLGTSKNFILTPNGGDYSIRPDWRVCDIESIWKYLQELNLLK